jgi:hypothetical protein
VSVLLERMKKDDAVGATPNAADSALQRRRFDAFLAKQPKTPASGAEREQLYKSFLDWKSRQPRN